MSTKPYNPLDKENLGLSVANAMLSQEAEPLGTLERFPGAGIYAIYYCGDFEPYSEISARNKGGQFNQPIYVGKAVPQGARKGGNGTNTMNGTALYSRLSKHAASIGDAENLALSDFYCRYLIVDDIWIPLGESLMITQSAPLWNQCIDGFGNNDPGKGRYNQLRSKWDVLHPGRVWANKCAERQETSETIQREVASFLANTTPGSGRPME